MKRIVLLGGQKIAADVLEYIIHGPYSNGKVVGVASCDEDRDVIFSGISVTEYCERYNLPYIKPQDSSVPEFVERCNPDIIFSVYYRKLLPQEIIDQPAMGCVNIHPSLLPKDRGPNPVYWCIRRGDEMTGTTLHYIDGGMDTGDIIDQKMIKVELEDTGFTLGRRLMDEGLRLFKNNYQAILSGKNKRLAQEHKAATCNVKYHDSFRYINWNSEAIEILRMVKAHTHPYAGSIAWNKHGSIVAWDAQLINEARSTDGPGTYRVTSRGVKVQTHDKPILITKWNGDLNSTGRFSCRIPRQGERK